MCSGIKRKSPKTGRETSFADALSIGPWCYRNNVPILLTGGDGLLTQDQVSALTELGFERIIVVGGTGVVGDIAAQLNLPDGACERLAGADRYETSKLVTRWEVEEQGMSLANVCVATGTDFPDALAGAALCGSGNSALILAKAEGSAGIGLIAEGRELVTTGYVLGGEQAVSEELLSYLERLTS